MPADRSSSSSRPPRPKRDSNGTNGRGGRARSGQGGPGRARTGQRRDGRDSDRSSRDGQRRNAGGRDSGRNSTGGAGTRRSRDDRGAAKRPRTEAERRAAEVKQRRGPRAPRDPDAERRRIEERTTEQWIDDGPAGDDVRGAAEGAAQRAGGGARSKRGGPPPVDPEVSRQLVDAVGKQRGERLAGRLQQASVALDRERFQEARRLAAAITKEVPDLAAGQQLLGLANYRLGYWKPAIRALEAANDLHPDPTVLPVLADCYRALGRWSAVDRVWLELRAASPAHEVLAEGRIVAAGALADQNQLAAAIELMRPATKPPKAVRDHHVRQWYVLGDLYDRTGDTLSARRWFGRILDHDPEFADAAARLRSLGR